MGVRSELEGGGVDGEEGVGRTEEAAYCAGDGAAYGAGFYPVAGGEVVISAPGAGGDAPGDCGRLLENSSELVKRDTDTRSSTRE